MLKIVADVFLDLYHTERLELRFAEDLYRLIVVHLDLDPAGEEAAFDNDASALRGVDDGVDLGEGRVFALVGVVLEPETAHKSAAGAAYLRRRKRKVLLLCHLD